MYFSNGALYSGPFSSAGIYRYIHILPATQSPFYSAAAGNGLDAPVRGVPVAQSIAIVPDFFSNDSDRNAYLQSARALAKRDAPATQPYMGVADAAGTGDWQSDNVVTGKPADLPSAGNDESTALQLHNAAAGSAGSHQNEPEGAHDAQSQQHQGSAAETAAQARAQSQEMVMRNVDRSAAPSSNPQQHNVH